MKIEGGKFVKRSPDTATQSPLSLSALLQTIQHTMQSSSH
jgi:hypothetical protein